jgi:hypothetical protein
VEADVMNEERASLARSIGRALLDPEFRAMLSVKGIEGDRPIYPARVEDEVGDVMRRLEDSGGAGNVVLRWENGLAVLTISAPVVEAKSKRRGSSCQEVGDTASIGTLLAVMAQAGLQTMLIRIVASVPPASGKPEAMVIEGSRAVLPAVAP